MHMQFVQLVQRYPKAGAHATPKLTIGRPCNYCPFNFRPLVVQVDYSVVKLKVFILKNRV